MASLVVEIWNSQGAIVSVKALVLQAVLFLLALLCFTTILGLSLGKMRQGNIVQAKRKRVVWLFAITIFVLLPIAYVLNEYTMQGQFNWFYIVLQTIEYAFDIICLVILGLNIRDGNTLVRQSQKDK